MMSKAGGRGLPIACGSIEWIVRATTSQLEAKYMDSMVSSIPMQWESALRGLASPRVRVG